jgi:hypothetical protein
MVNLWIATRTGSQESRQSVATAGAALKSLQVNRQANETGGRVVGLLVPRQKNTHARARREKRGRHVSEFALIQTYRRTMRIGHCARPQHQPQPEPKVFSRWKK